MPAAKSRPAAAAGVEDYRSDASITRERAAVNTRKVRNNHNGHAAAVSGLNGKAPKEQMPVTAAEDSGVGATTATLGTHQGGGEGGHGDGAAAASGTGMSWTTASVPLLDRYRLAHHLPVPAAFTSPYHLALLTNTGLGRQSPTMARRREKRRVAREQVAMAVRKNFNGAAVSETDVVVEMVYKVRHRDKAFRMRSAVPGPKKA